MIEETIQITVAKTTIETLYDAADFIEWARQQEGLTAALIGTVGGDLLVTMEGVTADRKEAALGDTIIWDGKQFTVQKPEPPEA